MLEAPPGQFARFAATVHGAFKTEVKAQKRTSIHVARQIEDAVEPELVAARLGSLIAESRGQFLARESDSEAPFQFLTMRPTNGEIFVDAIWKANGPAGDQQPSRSQ